MDIYKQSCSRPIREYFITRYFFHASTFGLRIKKEVEILVSRNTSTAVANRIKQFFKDEFGLENSHFKKDFSIIYLGQDLNFIGAHANTVTYNLRFLNSCKY